VRAHPRRTHQTFSPPRVARLDLLRQSGLLEQVLPEIAATITCDQSADFIPKEAFSTTFLMLKTFLLR